MSRACYNAMALDWFHIFAKRGQCNSLSHLRQITIIHSYWATGGPIAPCFRNAK
jgi:hypothetical protein